MGPFVYTVSCLEEKTDNVSKLNYLSKAPFNNWKTALKSFRSHLSGSPIHSIAAVKATEFHLRMANKVNSIDVQMNSSVARQIEENRQKPAPIVEIVMLRGPQNVSLRGHRDESGHFDESKNNPGNVRAIFSCFYRCCNNYALK